MKKILLILISLIPLLSFSQNEQFDEIKMKVIIDKQPLPGTSILIENTENQLDFNTDFNGEVKIKIPKDKNLVRLSFLGPIVRVKILRPTDSIIVNLDSKKVRYYFEGKRMKKRKIKFSGY